jgi:parallel beta-helix repeat protein
VRRIGVMSATLIAALAVIGCVGATASARGCSYVAASSGSDGARGTVARPFRSVQRLLNRLRPGQTGCVRGGTYRESVTVGRGGTSGTRRVTLESYPGERATLIGRLYVRESAPYVTIARINLNGTNSSRLPSPSVSGRDDAFVGDDVTDEHTGICFVLGSGTYGAALGTLIEGNRIHDCGRLPPTNLDHGLYVAVADGVRILDNVIFNNADRGIQLYPDAQGTIVEHNIIDANGEALGFGGEDGSASSNSLVAFNLITNSRTGPDVYGNFPRPSPPGANNVVRENCVFGGAYGTFGHEYGFQAAHLGNKAVDPHYANPSGGDYSVPSSNPCAALLAAGTPVRPF